MSSICCCYCWLPALCMGTCYMCCCCKSKRRPVGAKKLKESHELETPTRYNEPPCRQESNPSTQLARQISEDRDPYEIFQPVEIVQEEPKELDAYENRNVWSNPYTSEEYVTYIQQQMRGKVAGLAKEFKSLNPLKFRYESNEAKSMENRRRNTDASFIPYDMSRVLIKGEGSYINASVVPGYYREEQKYVIAQQPIVTTQGSTLGDFWQMVWEENIRCIVSLTPEGEGEKGAYWPKERNSELVFGSLVNVKLTTKTVYELSTHRTFIVSLEEEKRKSFLLHQIEFSAELIDKKSPSINLIVLSLIQQIRDIVCNRDNNTKLCFVCKSNNSMVGILMTLFEVTKPIEDKSAFSIYKTLDFLLEHRSGLITSYEHYQLIFVITLEMIQALKPISLLALRELEVGDIDPESEETNSVTTEYDKIDLFCNKAFFSKPHRTADSTPNKAQVTNAFPFDDNIVQIKDCPTGSTYINASYVHMESGVCPIIAAVHPVKGTLPEFLWLLITSEVQMVVVLAKQKEIDLMTDGVIKSLCYWSPTVYEKSFGSFNLLGSKPMEERGLLRYDVTVSYIPPGKEKLVHRFHLYLYKDWDDNDLPGDNKKCLDLLEFIQEFRTGANGDKPIVIQSIDGSTKLGVLLAVMNGSVQVLGGEEVDVPWIVKNLRCQRMKMVSCRVSLA